MDTNLIGKRIRLARQASSLTAEQLAERLGIASESLGHIECGARNTSLQTLIKIADILDVSLDYLAGRSNAPNSHTAEDQAFGGEELTLAQRKLLLDLTEQLVPVVKKHV